MRERTAIIFGAGNIGRGFLGQLYAESGYALVFVDVDEPLIDAINARTGYTIRLEDNDGVQAVDVSLARALHAQKDQQAITQAIAHAEIGATAVGVRALPRVAPLLAEGIARRAERREANPLNLIVCENLKGAAGAFRQMVVESLSPEHLAYFQAHIGFVDTVIGRMVPPLTPEHRAEDPGLIIVEPYKELPVDRLGFVGHIPAIVGMESCDNFGAYTARKLYIHNCGHAVLGYLGYLGGYTYGYQALRDPEVLSSVKAAMSESKAGITHAYRVEPVWLDEHITDLLHRFGNRALADTNFRLARDPLRKLGASDRLVGAARLAEEAGIQPKDLSKGIAAGYRFDHPHDPLAIELQQRIKTRGFDLVLSEVSGIDDDEPLGRMVGEWFRSMPNVAP